MTRKEKIIEILDLWSMGITETRNAVADEILALPIDVPGGEEIENKANGIANPESKKDFERGEWLGVKEGARWMRDEILKRNRP